MHWSKLLAGLAVVAVGLLVGGGLVGLLGTVAGNTAALAVVGLLVVSVLALARAGIAPNRLLSNPYWG